MPKLTIDDLEIEVPPGTKVIDAAEQVGIMIPRFCYLKELGPAGACRMCAVKFLQGPFKGVQMSCMVDAQDGMVVSTNDPEAVAFRKQVIEWLMLNHPHDCPVCDEGGQCLLQDETVSGGHGLRRYLGRKRTYRDQYLGAFIAHEMNRCIHCYRCSRFYQEYAGYRDLGPLQIADRVYFGRFEDGPLESPFSGNLVDICPTGVYTDKTARFRVRRWDLERAPSLCIHCSLGCHTVANARYREVVRIEGRSSGKVNAGFLCDRGRFGFGYAAHPERPRNAKIAGQNVPMSAAVGEAGRRLLEIRESSGAEAIAVLGSGRSCLETLGMVQHLSRVGKWTAPDFFEDPQMERNVKAVVSQLDARLAVSMRDVEEADCILSIGLDPVNEAPMLALAMRQAFRKDAKVVVVDPRPVFLPMRFEHLAVSPARIETLLQALLQILRQTDLGATPAPPSRPIQLPEGFLSETAFDPPAQAQFHTLVETLVGSRNPVILCGSGVVGESVSSLAAACAEMLQDAKGKGGIFYVLPSANAFGAALLASSLEHSFLDTVEGIENGTIQALVVVESDPLRHFPDGPRLQAALTKLQFLLVLDYLPSETVRRADIFLPTCTHFEVGGSFINQQGRLQAAEKVHAVGTPIHQATDEAMRLARGEEGGGKHPPRMYDLGIPGGEPKAAWEVLDALMEALVPVAEGTWREDPWEVLKQEIPLLASWNGGQHPADGLHVVPEKRAGAAVALPLDTEARASSSEESLQLLLVDWTFGTEELSQYAAVMRQVEGEPFLCMHPGDADRCGLAHGDALEVQLEVGSIRAPLKVRENMARGVMVLPRHGRIQWQELRNLSGRVPFEHIQKISTHTQVFEDLR